MRKEVRQEMSLSHPADLYHKGLCLLEKKRQALTTKNIADTIIAFAFSNETNLEDFAYIIMKPRLCLASISPNTITYSKAIC